MKLSQVGILFAFAALTSCEERDYQFADVAAMNGAMQGLVPSDAYDIRMTIWDDSGETWGSCSYTQLDISSLRLRLVPPHLVSTLEIPAGPTKWFERRLTSAEGRAGLAGWLIYVSDNSRYVLAADPAKKQCWFYSGNRVLAASANP